MSSLTIRSTFAGLFIMASSTSLPAQEAQTKEADFAQILIGMCTDSKEFTKESILPELHRLEEAALKYKNNPEKLAEIKDKVDGIAAVVESSRDANATYADILKKKGRNPAPCLP